MTTSMDKCFLVVLVLLASCSLYADTIFTLAPQQPGPVIHRNIYGQFMEHLGRGIYEGNWVGEDSSIPNIDGFRLDVGVIQIELPPKSVLVMSLEE